MVRLRLVGLLIGVALAVPAAAQEQQWRLLPDLRIGDADAPNYTLTDVSGIVVDRSGSIYVAQPRDGVIRVFSANGSHLRTIGRQGGGPGEFQLLGPIGLHGDSLYAIDGVGSRVSLFHPNGSLVRTIAVSSPPISGFGPAGPIALLADGSVLAQPAIPAAALGAGAVRVPVSRLSQSGEVLDTFPSLIEPRAVPPIRFGNQMWYIYPPVSFRPLTVVAPDGSVVVWIQQPEVTSSSRASFTVRGIRAPNQLAFNRSFSYRPLPLPRSVADSIRAIRVEDLSRFQSRSEVEQALRNLLPSYQPPVSRALVTPDGGVWLRREAYAPGWNWIVLDANGAALARVSVPEGAVLFGLTRDHAYGVEKDDLDIPYVVRYRIIR